MLKQQHKLTFTLVDHNVLSPEQLMLEPLVTHVIDHHAELHSYGHLEYKNIQTVGSCSTLVFERHRDYIDNVANDVNLLEHGQLMHDITYLLLASILIDTYNGDSVIDIAREADFKAMSQLTEYTRRFLYNAILYGKFAINKEHSVMTPYDKLVNDTKYANSLNLKLEMVFCSIASTITESIYNENYEEWIIEIDKLTKSKDAVLTVILFNQAVPSVTRELCFFVNTNLILVKYPTFNLSIFMNNLLQQIQGNKIGKVHTYTNEELKLTTKTQPNMLFVKQSNIKVNRKTVLPVMAAIFDDILNSSL